MKPINSNVKHLLSFTTDISDCTLPSAFTFPYYYTPHPLAAMAMTELQNYLETQAEWSYDFAQRGMMFGVLVVKNAAGDIGYLSSFCDDVIQADCNQAYPTFFVDAVVEAVVDVNTSKTQDLDGQLTSLELDISKQRSSANYLQLKQHLQEQRLESERQIAAQQQRNSEAKAERKQQRLDMESQLGQSIDDAGLQSFIQALGVQSSHEKRAFKALKQQWQSQLADIEEQYQHEQCKIARMETQHKELQALLKIQQQKSVQFLNRKGVKKSLFDLSSQSSQSDDQQPITQSSGQNLPKLLQAAFLQNLTPLALGEFWWGAAPYDQIRQHKNLYPVCQSKCFEVLQHMLEGIAIDPSPLEQTPSFDKSLDIVYEDDVLVVVNKPAEFLSVSGKYISDSVQARMQARYPHATGPMIVHRLDMSTSGLLVLTLSGEANKHVQKQFIDRRVEKRYTALLEGKILRETGVITLPLRGDLADRPRQMVCHEEGRAAETTYRVIDVTDNRTKIHLFPKTGRTHQLRVHCAHQAGLNIPIVGDDLYGFKDTRLHLHAGYLKFQHPSTGEVMEFEVCEDF
ncbi:RluA family pseudouridine synthase [Vibrio methylphosphonaticus]|uniref:RluA family pseudouridine synthase n=1 Tax=Vibrio methylphosphonaticus TaxID=2946866 RepID=UPI00202A0329|nr:RluA family pseudouridine synthase [Vibrio methylphosphonaticus]MCL9777154.1 pseudouridine synthase [Vibrio methylphosphonaticus]